MTNVFTITLSNSSGTGKRGGGALSQTVIYKMDDCEASTNCFSKETNGENKNICCSSAKVFSTSK